MVLSIPWPSAVGLCACERIGPPERYHNPALANPGSFLSLRRLPDDRAAQ
jgi:hypothetical protein